MKYLKEIRILNLDLPSNTPLNEELQWFSNCLGIFSKRDKEKSCFRVFINLLKEKDGLSSEKISKNSNLSRATVIHHISRLMDSGLVIERDKRYLLRVGKLEDLTVRVEKEVISAFKKLKEVSKRIDQELGF